MSSSLAVRSLIKYAKSLPSQAPGGACATGDWVAVLDEQLRSSGGKRKSNTTDVDGGGVLDHVAAMVAETAELKRLMYEFGGETKMTQPERMSNVAKFVGLGMPTPGVKPLDRPPRPLSSVRDD